MSSSPIPLLVFPSKRLKVEGREREGNGATRVVWSCRNVNDQHGFGGFDRCSNVDDHRSRLGSYVFNRHQHDISSTIQQPTSDSRVLYCIAPSARSIITAPDLQLILRRGFMEIYSVPSFALPDGFKSSNFLRRSESIIHLTSPSAPASPV
jgi:hypothetical protein